MGHGSSREGQEDHRVERGLQERARGLRLLPLPDDAQLAQVGRLLAGQAREFADGLVEGAVGARTQQKGHVGAGVGQIVVEVPEFVVGRAEPLLVGLDAHERTDVRLAVDVPGRRVAILLARRRAVHRIQVGFPPETLGKAGKAQRDVEVLGGAHHELAASALEEGIEAGVLDQARPRLRPAVAQPVRRDKARHRLLVAQGEGVLGEAVQPVEQRRDGGQHAVHEGHHLVHAHAVVRDLQGEEG